MRLHQPALILLIFLSSGCFGQSSEDIKKAAISELHVFLDRIPRNMEQSYGFQSRTEFEKAAIGEPVRVYKLAEGIITPTAEWRVPVIVDTLYRALLTVSFDSLAEVVDLGAKSLASELQSYTRQGPIGLLRVYSLQCDLIMCFDNPDDPQEYGIIPMQSALTRYGALEERRYSVSEILPILAEQIRSQPAR
jgi:hypothetical protein